MSETAGEKTFAPTEKRLRDAANKGDVLRSKDLGTAAVMLVGAAWLAFAGPWLLSEISNLLRESFQFDSSEIVDFRPDRLMIEGLTAALPPIFALAVPVILVNEAETALQKNHVCNVQACSRQRDRKDLSLALAEDDLQSVCSDRDLLGHRAPGIVNPEDQRASGLDPTHIDIQFSTEHTRYPIVGNQETSTALDQSGALTPYLHRGGNLTHHQQALPIALLEEEISRELSISRAHP